MNVLRVVIFISYLLVFIKFTQSLGELPFETAPGRCPRPRTIRNFQPEALVGTWYDFKRYKNTILTGSCGTARYSWNPRTQMFTIPYNILELKPRLLTLSPSDVPNGKFRTSLYGIPTPFDFWLIGTDYAHYHIVYTCVELIPLILNSQSINIFSRTPQLDPRHLNEALNIIERNGLNTKILRHVQQDNQICRRNSGSYYEIGSNFGGYYEAGNNFNSYHGVDHSFSGYYY